MFKKRWLAWLFGAVILAVSQGLVLWYSDDIKASFYLKNALGNHSELPAMESGYPKEVGLRTHVQAGVLLPDELLSGDLETDYNFAKSFLSEKQEWLFIESGRLPKITGLKGMGFGFKMANPRGELTLK